ncbi:MAG: type II secretion system protein J [Candidatus Omnitrophota bacterium]
MFLKNALRTTQYALRTTQYALRTTHDAIRNTNSGLTLIELIIAISLLSLIVLTAGNMDVASRALFGASDRQAELQNEVNPVLLRIKKDVNRAVGAVGDPGLNVVVNKNCLSIRVDLGGGSNFSYPANDNWVAYKLSGNQIKYYSGYTNNSACPPGGGLTSDIIANRITDFTITSLTSDFIPNFVTGVDVSLTARYDPSQAPNAQNNPELTLSTAAHALSQSAR